MYARNAAARARAAGPLGVAEMRERRGAARSASARGPSRSRSRRRATRLEPRPQLRLERAPRRRRVEVFERRSEMNCGSIAIALSAEYGDVSPGGISLIGSSCSSRWPAPREPPRHGSMSPISPMPQLRDEGIEKSGTRIPARRDGAVESYGLTERASRCRSAHDCGRQLRRTHRADIRAAAG